MAKLRLLSSGCMICGAELVGGFSGGGDWRCLRPGLLAWHWSCRPCPALAVTLAWAQWPRPWLRLDDTNPLFVFIKNFVCFSF